MEIKNVCIKNEDILLFSHLYKEFDCAPLIETHELEKTTNLSCDHIYKVCSDFLAVLEKNSIVYRIVDNAL